MSRAASLAMFLVLTVGGGLLIGVLTPPGAWFQGLAKPWFNPPGWVFAPVWTTLYILIAVAGWRWWQRAPSSGAMWLWWLALGLNFAWSPLFFGAHRPQAALGCILALLATILAFIAASWRLERTAAALFIPYACWVSFASLLNAAIVRLN